MKKVILLFFLIFTLFFIHNIFGQSETSEENYKYFHGNVPNVPYSGQIGGLALPSEGHIHALFIFAQFPDDGYDSTNQAWPIGGNPGNMNQWVDEIWSPNATPFSMTDYFNQMSLNKLKFTGKVISVITPHTRQWYLDNNKNRYHIHKDIIEQLDQTLDFAEFDRWSRVSFYNHINNPDGKVDFIFFIWRNIAMEYPRDIRNYIMQKLDMGWYGSIAKGYNPDYYTVDNGLRKVILNDYGSGCTVGDYFFKDAFRFAIHEFAHYLLGGNEYHNGHAFWAMLSGYEVRSYMINAWERYRLGWCNLITVGKNTQTISNATLPDFITTGIAYRIEIDAATNQYFYLENHQRISRWDNCSSDPNEKGIYVIRQDRASSSNSMSADWMWLVPAEGRFDWIVNKWTTNPWIADLLPVFKKGNANRETGYSPTDYIPVFNPYKGQTFYYEILFVEGPNGEVIHKPMRIGYGYDAFRPGYNEVFSPWSNPNSQRSNRNSTGIGFKINSVINGIYSIDIYVNTAISAPPSKPQNLTIACSGGRPLLRWYRNQEPDLMKYKIYKRVTPELGFQYIGETTDTFYVDNTEQCLTGPPEANEHIVSYAVTAVDNTNKESVLSDATSTRVKGLPLEKVSNQNKILSYKLEQNHPNPFNPSTKIKYSIKEPGLVTLKIYDLLGREIVTLVNEPKQAGEYEVEFDAVRYGLSSGVYLYQLTSGSFTSIKKLVLMK